ncbi:unnamed protein product, partial [Amoebophrya sp. A120]|eukprot:GSA120T00015491001.1
MAELTFRVAPKVLANIARVWPTNKLLTRTKLDVLQQILIKSVSDITQQQNAGPGAAILPGSNTLTTAAGQLQKSFQFTLTVKDGTD